MLSFSFLLLIFVCSGAGAGVRSTFVFKAEDGLGVVADKYFAGDSLPWVLMFHQAESSRGEFRYKQQVQNHFLSGRNFRNPWCKGPVGIFRA